MKKRIPRRNNLDLARTSFSQQGLWLLNQLDPDDISYNTCTVLRIRGPLNINVLAKALADVRRRHEILRTTFKLQDGSPHQVISPAENIGLDLPLTSLGNLPGEDQNRHAWHLIERFSELKFDLTNGPLIRSQLLQLGPEEFLLAVGLHHIITDGWSIGILSRELSKLYQMGGSGKPLDDLPIQYADYAEWQRATLSEGAMEKLWKFWQESLAGAPPAIDIWTDKRRPKTLGHPCGRIVFSFTDGLYERLKRVSATSGATLFMTLLAGFCALLFRNSGQDDMVVGVPISGRETAETHGIIGLFANLIPVRVKLPGRSTFSQLLQTVRFASLQAYRHQNFPISELVARFWKNRALDRSVFLPVIFGMHNFPPPKWDLSSLEIHAEERRGGTARFDMDVRIRETDTGLKGRIDYSASIFQRSTISRLTENYKYLLQVAVDNPDHPIATLPLQTVAHRERVVFSWNHPLVDRSHPRSLSELLEHQASQTPDAVAVEYAESRVTYSELQAQAGALASHLAAHGAGPETLVAVALSRSLNLILTLIAVLKINAGFVPLDPSHPPQRLQFILEDSGAALLVTESALEARFTEYKGHKLLVNSAQLCQSSRATGFFHGSADGVAYCIYTSGSTGWPKGVMVT
ncbi:MAG TPA: condensation domain-containing protein, partial [Terriglobia bacterium]|nr:condensation domain-containing protein [Terriglobia bacterium]